MIICEISLAYNHMKSKTRFRARLLSRPWPRISLSFQRLERDFPRDAISMVLTFTMKDRFTFELFSLSLSLYIYICVCIYIERVKFICEPKLRYELVNHWFHRLNQRNWLIKLFNMMKLYYMTHKLMKLFHISVFLT